MLLSVVISHHVPHNANKIHILFSLDGALLLYCLIQDIINFIIFNYIPSIIGQFTLYLCWSFVSTNDFCQYISYLTHRLRLYLSACQLAFIQHYVLEMMSQHNENIVWVLAEQLQFKVLVKWRSQIHTRIILCQTYVNARFTYNNSCKHVCIIFNNICNHEFILEYHKLI
jgi:hypothetical protein